MQMTAPPQGLIPLAPRVRRLIAPNPGPMTHWGTNSYVLGHKDLVVVDPGPDLPQHLDALAALPAPGQRIVAILVTHAHRDHSAGAAGLARRTGAPVLAFGNAQSGRSARMTALAQAGGLDGGEGVDDGFRPDSVVSDGQTLELVGLRITALWTPGHMANHLCFALPDLGLVLTGDLVMDWTTTLISPPDGDLGAYLDALDRLMRRRGDRAFLPGHGQIIYTPTERLAELRAHRLARHDQIRAALACGPGTASDIAARVYTDLAPHLLPAAARNTLAHLVEMVRVSEARADPQVSAKALFRAI